MSKYINNVYDYSSKDTINNSPKIQNNYYKEDKNISNNSKTRSDSLSIKNKSNTNSKNIYKVTYSNSILNNNINNNNLYHHFENKNVFIINDKINNSIGNIKEINYYSNKKNIKKRNNNNITSHNFYNKKINDILNSDNYYNKTINNNKSSNKTNINTDSNNFYDLNNKTHSTILNNSNINMNNSKNKVKKIKNIKNSSSKKKGLKIIYAKYPIKRPSVPVGNKYKNNLIMNNKNKSKKKEQKDKNSKSNKKNISKISLIQNRIKSKNNNYNNNMISLNYYSNYTNANDNNSLNINTRKNNLVPISLKYKISKKKINNENTKKEMKKSQSQSFFKPKLNNDLNISNSKYNHNKNKNDTSYKGIIMNRKNMIKNKIKKSSSHNSKSKKSPIVSINYKSKYLNNSNSKNKNYNSYFNNFINNNIPDEFNKNPLFLEIKNLWNKLGVTYTYREMLITLTKQIENKKSIFSNEINNLSLILKYLNKLNDDIKKRNEIIEQIKIYNYTNLNNNNIDDIKNLLTSLRMISIDVVNDYITFIKEISFDVLRKKVNLDEIKSFDKNYINLMKNDTNFLYKNNHLNKLFYFSNKSDPFLIYPSLTSPINNNENKYIQLPIDEETLEKINKCEYFMLTEKILEYSIHNNKEYLNSLLLNDQDNIINNIINTDTINKSFLNNDTENNNIIESYSINKNNASPFHTPNIKNQNNNANKTSIDKNKYNKFCYINNINNENNNGNINKNVDEKQYNESENLPNNNYLIDKMNNDINNNDINININDINNNDINNNDINNNDINNNDFNNNEIYSNNNDINRNNINNNDINNNAKLDKNISIINNSNDINYSTGKEKNNNIQITPYNSNQDNNLTSLYSSYLSSVPDNIKQSFDINEDIYYYSNIGIYPKIILFKDNKTLNIKGMCTISFNQNINSIMSLDKKILVITSISCSNGEKISEILLNLIEFCKNEEIIYDSIEVNLYYMKKEEGNFVLDEGLEKEIKSEAKFKWVRLENDGEKRKIKYHYIPNNIITNKENSILNNLNMNNIDICNKYAIFLNNYVLIKYFEESGINDISMVEHSKLFFIIYLLKKYFLLNENSENIEKDKENILINLKGLKLKKIVRILSEYNSVILTNSFNFRDDYLRNDNNYNTDHLLNNFLDIIEKDQNDNEKEQNDNGENNICLNFNNLCTNFSNIIKVELDEYEYNIISMNDFIIEVFHINNDNDKEVIYFSKSEIENISFIFYEQNDEDKNKSDENYIKSLFNKVLKKILIKDSEEPIKSYKKLAIPSFSYQKKIIEDKSEEDKLKIIEYNILDCNESFNFCIENIKNYNTKFSFPLNKNIFENEEIKVIKNNFVVAVLNPDLILDYHLPSMNIYYIDKKCWIKVKK